jgi:transcriptional regulator GlxA family with amidase domain
VTGPLEVFATATQVIRESGRGYHTLIAAPTEGVVHMGSGLRLYADQAIANVSRGIDTLIVAGGLSSGGVKDPALVNEVARLAPGVRRLASVCTGALALAEAGLLRGRRATTHWQWCNQLAKYPDVQVERDAIYVRDGNVWTSAGVTAGMDLALAMVEQDHGLSVALEVARQLVLFMKRSGGQSQYSAVLASQQTESAPMGRLLSWIPEHIGEDLSVTALAKRAGMSPRNFARAFARDVGTTPARLVEQVRIEAAQRRLEQTTDSIETISTDCGFGTPETLRRAFLRQLSVCPAVYRKRFEVPGRAGPDSEPPSSMHSSLEFDKVGS